MQHPKFAVNYYYNVEDEGVGMDDLAGELESKFGLGVMESKRIRTNDKEEEKELEEEESTRSEVTFGQRGQK